MAWIAPVLHGFRFFTYSLFAAALLAELYFAPPVAPVRLALAVLGGLAMAQARLRHAGLALAVVLAPLPAILWFGTSAYALLIAFAILAAAAYSDALLKGQGGPAALWQPAPALAGTLLFAILWSLHVSVQLPGLMAASAATILFLPALALTTGFDEAAIARGNRQRESWQRIFAFAARIAEPRWSLSLSGAGLVLAVLAYFEIAQPLPGFDWLAAIATAVLVLALTRDGYCAVAALAASALLLLFTHGVNGSSLLFLLFALTLGRAIAGWRRKGETETLALARAIEDHGATFLFAGSAAMIAAAARGGSAAALHALFTLIAVILFAAFTGALRALFPRRRSVEELYRA